MLQGRLVLTAKLSDFALVESGRAWDKVFYALSEEGCLLSVRYDAGSICAAETQVTEDELEYIRKNFVPNTWTALDFDDIEGAVWEVRGGGKSFALFKDIQGSELAKITDIMARRTEQCRPEAVLLTAQYVNGGLMDGFADELGSADYILYEDGRLQKVGYRRRSIGALERHIPEDKLRYIRDNLEEFIRNAPDGYCCDGDRWGICSPLGSVYCMDIYGSDLEKITKILG